MMTATQIAQFRATVRQAIKDGVIRLPHDPKDALKEQYRERTRISMRRLRMKRKSDKF